MGIVLQLFTALKLGSGLEISAIGSACRYVGAPNLSGAAVNAEDQAQPNQVAEPGPEHVEHPHMLLYSSSPRPTSNSQSVRISNRIRMAPGSCTIFRYAKRFQARVVLRLRGKTALTGPALKFTFAAGDASRSSRSSYSLNSDCKELSSIRLSGAC